MADKMATIGEVCKFFDLKLGQFRTEWNALTDDDKTQLKTGVGNGSFTY